MKTKSDRRFVKIEIEAKHYSKQAKREEGTMSLIISKIGLTKDLTTVL